MKKLYEIVTKLEMQNFISTQFSSPLQIVNKIGWGLW